MTGRRAPVARRTAWVIWGATLVLMIVWIPLVRTAKTQEGSDLLGLLLLPLFVMGFATVGALITSRQPSNRIGLAYALLAMAGAVALVSGAYAQLPFSAGISVPGDRIAAWLGRVGFALTLAPIPFVFLLFPDGRVSTPRWRPVLWVMLAATAVNQLGYALTPGSLAAGFTYTPRSVTNPFGLPASWKAWLEPVTLVAGMVVLLAGALGVVALVLRYRRAEREQRQQIRWLAYVGAAAVGIVLTGIAVSIIISAFGGVLGDAFFSFVILPFFLVLMIGIPGASVVSVFKYRLWDLDIVVKKTLIAGILVVIMGVIAAGVFATIGQVALWKGTARGVSVAVGVAVGLLFVPALRLSRRVADRLVYGGRATPYEVLTEFSKRMAETYSTEDVLPRMAAIVAAGTGAEHAAIWLAIGRELRSVAEWPEHASPSAPFAVDDLARRGAFEVRHLGELLGAITVEMPANDPMDPGKERIVRDLASQAGLVLRNVKLIEDLRASRQRLVAAQDEERRKIERNIHDGAQQQLVALAVKLRLTEQLAEREPARAKEMLGDLQAEATDALENLRDLARGIYPPLLADRGLAPALEAQARKVPIPIILETDGVGRYAQDVESAIYFSCLEALQNATKYSNATRIDLRVGTDDGHVRFEVRDDGRGFDTATVAFGTGLQGIADRLAALGGSIEVRSAPGEGTTVAGRVPAPAS